MGTTGTLGVNSAVYAALRLGCDHRGTRAAIAGRADDCRIRPPPAIVNRVSTDIQAILREAGFRDKIIERGSIPAPGLRQSSLNIFVRNMEKWARVAKAANVRLD